jgi:hypothetical protein
MMNVLFFLLVTNWSRANTEKPEKFLGLSNYKVKIEWCRLQKETVLSLREFKLSNQVSRWIVNPQTLQTLIIVAQKLKSCRPATVDVPSENSPKLASLNRAPYIKALNKYTEFTGKIQGQGLRSDQKNKTGVFLTIDLCPSKAPIDKSLFIEIGQKRWPVAIAVSGLWILKHPQDWEWLQATLRDSPVLWVNHSRNHPVLPDLPLEKNYLLLEGRDIANEILANEKLFFRRGIVPSVFFRFPGLVANAEALKVTRNLGLIPLASNAWIGKHQWPKGGSVVLLHGNGNDPLGLALFNKLKDNHQIPEPFRDLLSIFSQHK